MFTTRVFVCALLLAAASIPSAGKVEAPHGGASTGGNGLTIDQLPACSATIWGAYGSAARSSYSEYWLGSAFVIDAISDTLVMITNRHCLGIDDILSGTGGIQNISDYGLQVEFPTGQVRPVTGCAFFWDVDLAALIVPARGLREGRDYFRVPMYEGDDVRIGDEVVASGTPSDNITDNRGNPLYYPGTVTFGRISAFRELYDVPVIQMDAAINHGNSGGPLLIERDGLYYCIGVNTYGTGDETIEGIGFAIDLARVQEVVDQSDMRFFSADANGLLQALAEAGYSVGTYGRGRRVDGGGSTSSGRGHRVN